jgi:hypothetical protein
MCASIDTTAGINWYYCVYQLILMCVSIDTTVGINWYYCVYQLILLWVSIDTIPCINWYYCVYQLILSMLSDYMFQLFFFLKTSHTRWDLAPDPDINKWTYCTSNLCVYINAINNIIVVDIYYLLLNVIELVSI